MGIYIKSSACISALETFEADVLPNTELLDNEGYLQCIAPDYKKYISAKLLRRMSPIIRNGVAAGISALKNANVDKPDAIITGTSLGCLKDTESFLKQLITEGEELPNPTAFIQSTHNTIAGQLALILSCKNYNFTFTQMHQSFESSLLDAQLMLHEGEAENILVGGVDELNETMYNIIKSMPCYKNCTLGEGAAFFVLSNEKSSVCFKGMRIVTTPTFNFDEELAQLNLKKEDVDVIIGGDNTTDDLLYSDIHKQCNDKSYLWYKPFFGEFGTVSALAFWLAIKILETNKIPNNWLMHKSDISEIRNIVIYNNTKDEHSLMALSKV